MHIFSASERESMFNSTREAVIKEFSAESAMKEAEFLKHSPFTDAKISQLICSYLRYEPPRAASIGERLPVEMDILFIEPRSEIRPLPYKLTFSEEPTSQHSPSRLVHADFAKFVQLCDELISTDSYIEQFDSNSLTARVPNNSIP